MKDTHQALWEQIFALRGEGLTWDHIAQIILDASGWRCEGEPPSHEKYVVVAAPHTDWWDGWWMVVASIRWGMQIKWLVKHTVLDSPGGPFLRALGAIPVDRREPQGLVAQLVREFEDRDELVLAIPPEGTRKKREMWKSGFYHIARAAGVPICLTSLDYGEKVARMGPCFFPTDDMSADMDIIRRFYMHTEAKHPERFTFPVLREEGLTEAEARARVGA